jgi:NADPH:quinone reductase-like Zn-dependent oxidoreductase
MLGRPDRVRKLNTKMTAQLRLRYGPPGLALTLTQTDVPVPKDDEVLVRVRASSVNPADWYNILGKPILVRLGGRGFLRPKSPLAGADVSGLVASAGKDVKEFHAGDEVFGICSGSYAEYVTVPEKDLALKPANLSFEEAATVPLAGLTALQGVRTKGNLQPGQKVLIHGASGGVGTFAVQIAKALGGTVTAVCNSDKVDLARSLGADQVIDYRSQDFAQTDTKYDLVVGVNGRRRIGDYLRILAPEGRCVYIGGTLRQAIGLLMFGKLRASVRKGRLRFFIMQATKDDLLFLRQLVVDGKVKPVLDRNFSLSAVPDALEYLHAGHVRGKVSVTVP